MASSFHARLFIFCIAVLGAAATDLNVSGEAITARYWDCCKPSCGWKPKADVISPVQSCSKDGGIAPFDAGTGCNGGAAFQCASHQPWAVNDTFAYGFVGAFLLPSLVGAELEGAWCCACYRLDFTSDPLRSKSMIVQASNTAFDITTANQFTLAIPGGNVSDVNGCATQYGVQQSVFGSLTTGVSSKDDCQNLPEPLRPGCEFRFDWMEDQTYPTAKFQRVACPSELTDKTQCIRKDEAQILNGTTSGANFLAPSAFALAAVLTFTGLSTI